MSAPKRIQYHEYGGPEVMRLEEFSTPNPGKGEVLVRVRAASVNPMDAGIRRGRLKSLTGRSFPRGLGHDLAGVVEAVGPDVARLRVGDDVVGFAGMKVSGAIGEFAIVEEQAATVKPAGLSFEEAATLPVPAGTAYEALVVNGHLQPGHAVFVTGCLGAVGRSAVAIALAHGASVAGSVRDPAASAARALGVQEVVGFDFDVPTQHGKYDIVVESSGRLAYRDARSMLKRGGVIVDLIPSPAKFLRSALPGPYKVQATKGDPAHLDAVLRLAADRALQLPIDRTVGLADAVAAITEYENNTQPGRGKLVVTMP